MCLDYWVLGNEDGFHSILCVIFLSISSFSFKELIGCRVNLMVL
jgi:hypothetical protein